MIEIQRKLIRTSINSQYGVYKLIAVDENGRRIKLQRLIGTDDKGVLYIGTTQKKETNLCNRLLQLERAINIGRGHAAGNRYQKSQLLQDTFPRDLLRLEIKEFENFLEAQSFEASLLKKYFNKFGELPPFNRNLPKERDQE